MNAAIVLTAAVLGLIFTWMGFKARKQGKDVATVYFLGGGISCLVIAFTFQFF